MISSSITSMMPSFASSLEECLVKRQHGRTEFARCWKPRVDIVIGAVKNVLLNKFPSCVAFKRAVKNLLLVAQVSSR